MGITYKLSLVVLLALLLCTCSMGANSKVFREYIGAQFNNVKFSDVPINSKVQFDYILAFAIDYAQSSSPSPTNGRFNVYWDSANLSPREVKAIKSRHKNVRVALSLGGDTVGNGKKVQFVASSVSSWVNNAVSSLSQIIKKYDLDGIDIDYEHFDRSQPAVFAECIGQLITTLKRNGVISLASIAPFDDGRVQAHYGALWRKYGHLIDYVNFQFYAYDKTTTVAQFIQHYNDQASRYKGGKVLASFGTDSASGGLSAERGFFRAAAALKKSGKLQGIFVWSADDSKRNAFRYEKRAQALLAG